MFVDEYTLPEGITECFENSDKFAFRKLDNVLSSMEKSEDTLPKAIAVRENGVFAGRETFGKEHPLVQEAVRTLVLKCNSFAMQLVAQGKY